MSLNHSSAGLTSPSFRPGRLTLQCLIVGILGFPAVQAACTPKIYTTTSDWNGGILFNTRGVEGALTLVDPGEVRTFPHLWPANAGEDTVSKFDADINKEVGRYRTWFDPGGVHSPWAGPAPSRTSVDGSGNVYVTNRVFTGRRISVLKILASDAGAVDRNGNGKIDTAVDTNNDGVVTGAEILPILDDGANGGIAGNGFPEIGEIRDERIAWLVEIGNPNELGRSCALDPSGNLWVGTYNTGVFYKLNSATGAVISGPRAAGVQQYGAVIDSGGILYGATLSSWLTEFDTNTGTLVANRSFGSNYGIALDDSRDKVYLGNNAPYSIFDTSAKTFASSPNGPHCYGISTASNGDIIVHSSRSTFPNYVPGVAGDRSGVTRWRPDGSVAWSSGSQAGAAGDTGSRGVPPDGNGDIFTINLSTHNVSKYRGSDGAHLGVFPIGNQPYSYSDLSGSSFLQTNLIGTWTAEHNDVRRGNKECIVRWDGTGPGSIKVELAGSNTAGVPGAFVQATNGVVVPGVAGKYITARVTLQAAAQQSPSVQELSVDSCPQIGDYDNDCSIEMDDYVLMRSAHMARSTDPKWDINGDGAFNVADLRHLVVLFCLPGGTQLPPRS